MNSTISDEARPKNNGSKQLFASPILEKLSSTHMAVLVAIFFCYAAAILLGSISHTGRSTCLTVFLFFFAMLVFTCITIATLLLIICQVLRDNLSFAFISGFLGGYAWYLSVYYIVHAYPSPTGWLKILWINHAIHYCKDGDVVFDVASPLCDDIYGTMAAKGINGKSE